MSDLGHDDLRNLIRATQARDQAREDAARGGGGAPAAAAPSADDEAARLRAEIARIRSGGQPAPQQAAAPPPAYEATPPGGQQQQMYHPPQVAAAPGMYQPPNNNVYTPAPAGGGMYQPPSNAYVTPAPATGSMYQPGPPVNQFPPPANAAPPANPYQSFGPAAGMYHQQATQHAETAGAAAPPNDEAARLREEIARMKQKEANPYGAAPAQPAQSAQEAEMAALRAEVERMRLAEIERARAAERAREEAALRAEIERMKNKNTQPAPVDPEIARLRAEVERMRSGGGASAPAMTPDQIEKERLRRELEELRNAAPAPAQPPVDSETLRLRQEVEDMKRQLAARQHSAPTPAAAASAPAAPAPYAMDPEVAALTKMLQDLQNGQKTKETARHPDIPPTTNSAQLDRLAEEERRMKAETERMQAQIQETLRRQRMEIDDIKNKTSSAGVSQAQMNAMVETYQKKVKGVDIAILMDCTGSMSSWIAACVQKIGEIVAQSRTLDCIINVAFVGYRDYCDGHERFVTSGVDFIPANRVGELQNLLGTIKAKGGGDEPEDVAGGLNLVKQLRWTSSTKLIMHFGDAPPHGVRYHDASMGDTYPDGDPDGVVPESVMRHFCANGIDFYSVEIRRASTQTATTIFLDAYGRNKDGAASGKGQFYVMTLGDDVNQFMPTFIKSIQTSMSNRRMVEKNTASLT